MQLSEIGLDEVDRLQHVALMRLTLRVQGETHRIIGAFQSWLVGEVRRRAEADGTVGTAELAGLPALMESRWKAAMREWTALFTAAREQAGSLPFGALVVRHNHFMGLVQPQPLAESRSLLQEDLSPAEMGTLINLWQDRRARALEAASTRTMPDRMNLSQRIWRLENAGLAQIQGTVGTAFAERTNAYDLAARLEEQLGANQDLPRWTSTRLYRMTPTDRMNDERGLLRGEENRGRGIAYNALRLARTEIQYANVYNHIEIARHSPWMTGKKVRLSPQHPVSDVCDGLAEGGPYPVTDVVIPAHPNCLCYEEYVVMDDQAFAQRTREWLAGNNDFLDEYQGWLGSIQPTQPLPWAMTIADSLELWMSMSGDGHAAVLRLRGGRSGGEDGATPGPRPPVVPRPTTTPRTSPVAQAVTPPAPTPQFNTKTAAMAREELARIEQQFAERITAEQKALNVADKPYKALVKEATTLRSQMRKATDEEMPELTAKYDDVVRKITALNVERQRNQAAQLAQTQQERAEALRRAVQVDNPARNQLRILNMEDAGYSANWQKGMDEFNKLVSADLWSGKQIGVLGLSPGGRASAKPESSTIKLTGDTSISTTVHEIAHVLEVKAGLYNQVRAFYDRRTSGEALEQLSTITGKSSYREDEVARRDKWMSPYMGKDYAATTGDRSTELVSMGVEYLYQRPDKLAKEDPEYFDFIYNLVRGR